MTCEAIRTNFHGNEFKIKHQTNSEDLQINEHNNLYNVAKLRVLVRICNLRVQV